MIMIKLTLYNEKTDVWINARSVRWVRASGDATNVMLDTNLIIVSEPVQEVLRLLRAA